LSANVKFLLEPNWLLYAAYLYPVHLYRFNIPRDDKTARFTTVSLGNGAQIEKFDFWPKSNFFEPV
jgi:hypothetical protein